MSHQSASLLANLNPIAVGAFAISFVVYSALPCTFVGAAMATKTLWYDCNALKSEIRYTEESFERAKARGDTTEMKRLSLLMAKKSLDLTACYGDANYWWKHAIPIAGPYLAWRQDAIEKEEQRKERRLRWNAYIQQSERDQEYPSCIENNLDEHAVGDSSAEKHSTKLAK